MALTTLTQQGAVDAALLAQLNANFSAVAAKPDYWVRPQASSTLATGSYTSPFGSLTLARPVMEPGVVIGIVGVLREQFTTPLGVNNVTLVGQQNIPRQSTTSGVPNGGGAVWLVPSSGVSASSALIRVQGQGWTLANLYFNSTSITSNGAIEPHTVGDPPAEADAAHLLIYNCIITGAKYGVYCPTGTNYVRIVDSEIFGYSDSGDVAIQATGGIGTLLDWRISGCKLYSNANQIIAALNKGWITGCAIDSGTVTIALTNGTAPNRVIGNSFNIAAADFDPAGGVTGVTGDVWSNTLTDTIETGLPAN